MSNEVIKIDPIAPPFYSPPYAPTWTCKGFRRISAICEADDSTIAVLLSNTPFTPTGSRIEFFIDDMSGHSLGSFNESGILVPVTYQGIEGLYHPVIFITTDVGLIAGREVFGYPKLLGDVGFNQSNGHFIGTTARNGEVLFQMDFEPAGDPVDLKQLMTLSDTWSSEEYEWTHHLLVKSIPSPFQDKPDVLSIIYRNLSAILTNIQPGNINLEIGIAKEVNVAKSVEVVAGYLLEGDFGAGFNEDRRILASL